LIFECFYAAFETLPALIQLVNTFIRFALPWGC